jgi:ppGpp synthetase/RelA/SpoT-type nucleotidyltranferase
MLDRAEFLSKYRIAADRFAESTLGWDELEDIYQDFIASQPQFLATANYISERLRALPGVHSIKLRVKDPEHLIEKIIRKKIADPGREITRANYATALTDLIGLRALHLFKDEWRGIHDGIKSTWDLHEPPTAYIRRGDPEALIDQFKVAGCEIREHELGYRSIHYLVRSQPEKQAYVAEVQVRTIFEEGWSEVDHQVRYPYDVDNAILGQFLVIFNRLAGSADEMGSFVKLLKRELQEREQDAAAALEEKNTIISKLQERIQKLKVAKAEKDTLKKGLDELSRAVTPSTVTISRGELEQNALLHSLQVELDRLAHDTRTMLLGTVAESPRLIGPDLVRQPGSPK